MVACSTPGAILRNVAMRQAASLLGRVLYLLCLCSRLAKPFDSYFPHPQPAKSWDGSSMKGPGLCVSSTSLPWLSMQV